MKSNKCIELRWHGKDDMEDPEPRLLIEKDIYESGKKGIDDNLLIYGDNLLGLKSLEKKYTGKIKCIYIDPPYNTKKAFKHYKDNLKHSLWLNMMKERLHIMHKLLREDGSIWISIDDNECHYLKVMCDEIFGRENFVATLPTIMNLKGNQDQFGFAGVHEYTIVYAKNNYKLRFNEFLVDEEEIRNNWKKDEIGFYKEGACLKATGVDAFREQRPNLFFPIYVSNFNEISLLKKPGFTKVLPITNGKEMRWRWSKEKVLENLSEIIIKRKGVEISLYKKQRPNFGNIPTKKPKSVFYKPEYSSGNGTNQIKRLFGKRNFDYPKPEHLIFDFLTIATNPGDIVLDSFAGSGTTGAVAHKMKRRWIMIELGEHCHSHIIPRMEKVINGEDSGGVTEMTEWKGGGSFRYCEMENPLCLCNNFRWCCNNPLYQ